MATKSILKDIQITDKKTASSLLAVFEKLDEMEPKPIVVTKTVKVISREKIRQIFGDAHDRL